MKRGWVIASVLTLMVLAIIGSSIESALLKQSLADADRLWESGQEVAALDKYRSIANRVMLISEPDRSRVVSRVVDADCEVGQVDNAKQLIENGLRFKIPLTFESLEAKNLLSQIMTEREHAKAQANADANKTIITVKKGWFGGKVDIEIRSELAEAVVLDEFECNGFGMCTFKATCKMQLRGGREMKFTCYDADGTVLESGPVLLGGNLRKDTVVKGKLFFDTEATKILMYY